MSHCQPAASQWRLFVKGKTGTRRIRFTSQTFLLMCRIKRRFSRVGGGTYFGIFFFGQIEILFCFFSTGQNQNHPPNWTRRRDLTGKVCPLLFSTPSPDKRADVAGTVFGLEPRRRCARVSAAAAGAGSGRARLLASKREGGGRAGEGAEEHHRCDEASGPAERWAWPPPGRR